MYWSRVGNKLYRAVALQELSLTPLGYESQTRYFLLNESVNQNNKTFGLLPGKINQYQQNASLQCRGNAEASSEVA